VLVLVLVRERSPSGVAGTANRSVTGSATIQDTEEERRQSAETQRKTQRDRRPQPNGPIVRMNVLQK